MVARLESNQPAPKFFATEGPEGLYPTLLPASATDACLESQHHMGATISRAMLLPAGAGTGSPGSAEKGKIKSQLSSTEK